MTPSTKQEAERDLWLYEEYAKQVSYDGVELRWSASKNKNHNGQVCGRRSKEGYLRINSNKHRTMIAVHRLIFFILNGYLPAVVDHRDGDPTNNRAGNLRAATFTENARNAKTSVKNTSGRKGVYWHKQISKWQASIRANGKLKYLGIFNNFEDAVSARVDAERKYHGEFCRNQ